MKGNMKDRKRKKLSIRIDENVRSSQIKYINEMIFLYFLETYCVNSGAAKLHK